MLDSIGREIQKISPPISHIWPPIKVLSNIPNRTIGIIRIPKAYDCFRSIQNTVFIRQEKSNKRLTPQEIIKLSYAKGFEKADKELVNIDFSLINTDEFQSWKNNRNINDNDIQMVLEKTGLARKDDKNQILPTRAAVLLFSDYPTDIMETKCAIRVLQYTGTLETYSETPNLISVPKTINGPLIKQILDTHEYVLNTLRVGIRIPSGFTNQYIIPERAIKEAITNAVIHRDYYIKRDIEIKIFEDRVEIESPGLFPFNITTYNIGYVRSEGYRNDLLVKHLREFPNPPNLDQNEGVKAMRSEMNSRSLYPPIFFTYPLLEDSVRVVLLNEKRVSEWEKVNQYLIKNKYITNTEARNVTGIVQRDRMTQILRSWVKNGLLVKLIPKSGFVKGTKYKLSSSPYIDEKS